MSQDKEFGSLKMEYAEPLIAGELTTIRFVFTVGSSGMKEGGRVRFALPNPGWGEPLLAQHYFWDCYQKGKERRYTNYDRVNTTARVQSAGRKAVPFLTKWPGFRKPFGIEKHWKRDYDRWWIEAALEDDGLDPGDTLTLTYGDPECLPYSAYVQRFPDGRLWFLAFVDPMGDNSFYEAVGSPWRVAVEAGEASQINAVAPSVVVPGQRPTVKVSYMDDVKVRPRNPVPVERVTVHGTGGSVKEVSVDETTTAFRTPFPEPPASDEDTVVRVRVEDPRHNFVCRSNPAVVRSTGPRLFWGDLHVQSMYHGWSEADQVGISCGTPESIYDYAENVTGLDFCAITDSATLCKDVWQDIRQAALNANRDGEFVVFQGSELGDNIDGHRNTIFATAAPEPRQQPDPDPDKPTVLPAHKAQDLFHDRTDVLMMYHHTKVWNNWSRWDPTVESLLEIYSCWGSGEKPGTDLWDILAEHTGGAQEAWAKGYRLGVVAGSDTHTGTPGRDLWHAERDEMFIYPCGLAAVWADELTRESVFASLKSRCCYGTTGARILLEFFVNGNPMGTEIRSSSADSAREITLNVCGTGFIDIIEILKNNEPVAVFEPEAEDFTGGWRDTAPAEDGDYYYARVKQRDNHRAWSSPIWVDLV